MDGKAQRLMSLMSEIFSVYRGPRRAMRRLIERGVREEQILFYGMLFCLLTFVAQMPMLARSMHLAAEETPPLIAVASGRFVGLVFIGPLLLYAIGALSHLIARIFGGSGSWLWARLAIMWGALASVPLVLLFGGLQAVVPLQLASILSLLTTLGFLWIWLSNLFEAEFGKARGQ